MICPIYQNLFAIGMPVEKNRSRSLCFEIEWCYTFCQQVIGDATLKSGIIEHAVSVEAQFRLFDWYLNNHRLESD